MNRKIQRRSFFRKKRFDVKGLKTLLSIAFILASIFYSAIFLLPVVPKESNISNSSEFKIQIKPQSGLASISDQLQAQGISVNILSFQISAKALFVGSKLKPGTYLLPTGASLGKILLQIARGDRVRENIAIIPERMSLWQLRAMVDAHPALIHLTKGMTTKDLLQSLNLSYPNAEGIFLPDTYIFDPDEPDLNIYRRASQAMQKQLIKIWAQRAEGLPLQNPYQLLILASIVEKETGRSSDRGMISAVFVNRLNLIKGCLCRLIQPLFTELGRNLTGIYVKRIFARTVPTIPICTKVYHPPRFRCQAKSQFRPLPIRKKVMRNIS